jgi:hypothetical protein
VAPRVDPEPAARPVDATPAGPLVDTAPTAAPDAPPAGPLVDTAPTDLPVDTTATDLLVDAPPAGLLVEPRLPANYSAVMAADAPRLAAAQVQVTAPDVIRDTE